MVGSPGKTKVSQRRDRTVALRYARDTVAATRHPVRIAAGLVVLLGVVLVAAVASGVFGPTAPSLTPAQIAARAAERATRRLLAQEASAVRAADALVAVKLPGGPPRRPPLPRCRRSSSPRRSRRSRCSGTSRTGKPRIITAADLADTSVHRPLRGRGGARRRIPPVRPGLGVTTPTTGYGVAHRGRARRPATVCSSPSRRPTGASSTTSTHHPAPTSARLAAAMAHAVAAGGLDGVDIDIEGSSHGRPRRFRPLRRRLRRLRCGTTA